MLSKPAGAPCRIRCTLFGDGEKGRTSQIKVCDEKEGVRRKFPLGDRDKEVGVSVSPNRVETCSFLRMSNICRK